MKLLLAELHHLGDAVLTAPLIRAAARQHEIHVLCRPPVAEIFRPLLPGARIHGWQPPWHEGGAPTRSAREQAAALREMGFGLAACAWADPRVQLLFARARIPRRIGFSNCRRNYYGHRAPWRARRLLAGQFLAAATPLLAGRPGLTEALLRPAEGQTHLEDVLQLARACGLEPDLSTPWFPADAASAPSEAVSFAAAQRRAGRMLWVVHPGARLPTKRWPTERFEAALETLLAEDPGLAFLVVRPQDGPDWHLTGDRVAACRSADFAQLLGLVALADALLCHDSLLSHLAAAQGKRVAALFGSGDPAWFAPWRNETGVVANDLCPYRPCVDRCRLKSPICILGLDVPAVVARVREMAMLWKERVA